MAYPCVYGLATCARYATVPCVCKAMAPPAVGAPCDSAYTVIHAAQSNLIQSLTCTLISLQGFLGVLAIYIGAIAIVIANVGRSKMADTSYCIQVMQSKCKAPAFPELFGLKADNSIVLSHRYWACQMWCCQREALCMSECYTTADVQSRLSSAALCLAVSS